MKYRKIEGYKYQLFETEVIKTPIIPEKEIFHEYFTLSLDGTLVVKKWYAWDGPSGPTIDTKNFIKDSLPHDVFFQGMRLGLLSKDHFHNVNKFLYNECLKHGMNRFRAWYVFQSVELFGRSNITPRPEDKNPVIEV